MSLLLESVRQPWASAYQLAVRASVPADTAQSQCDHLVEAGLMQAARLNITRLPPAIYAPTNAGVGHAAAELGLKPAALLAEADFSARRFELLRLAAERALTLNAIGAATSGAIRGTTWQTVVLRQFRRREVVLHARLDVPRLDTFWLLLDDDTAGPWPALRRLQYFERMARQRPSEPPLVLALAASEERLQILLRLRAVAGFRSRFAGTADLREAIARGLSTCSWVTAGRDRKRLRVDPFARPGLDSPEKSRNGRKRKSDMFDLDSAVEPAMGSLTADARCVLKFIAAWPICPESSIASLLGMALETVEHATSVLAAAGLVTASGMPNARCWTCTPDAIAILASSRLDLAEPAVAKYASFARAHARATAHTLAVHDFFSRLADECRARSRAMRYYDAPQGGLNDGRIGVFEMADARDEMDASDWFTLDGRQRAWRPDGFGSVYAGAVRTDFFLEMDSWIAVRAQTGASRWARKAAALCDYARSDCWALRYRELARLLIVMSDLSGRAALRSAFAQAVRRRAMSEPDVFLAADSDLRDLGAFAPIWVRVSGTGEPGPGYAFEGVADLQPAQSPKRVSLLDELDRADRLGLLGLPEPGWRASR